jgi:hypothetical protein
MADTCKTCRWFLRADKQPRNASVFDEGDGECRIRAPSGGGIVSFYGTQPENAKSMSALIFPWPVVHEADFCGEHQPQPKEETL